MRAVFTHAYYIIAVSLSIFFSSAASKFPTCIIYFFCLLLFFCCKTTRDFDIFFSLKLNTIKQKHHEHKILYFVRKAIRHINMYTKMELPQGPLCVKTTKTRVSNEYMHALQLLFSYAYTHVCKHVLLFCKISYEQYIRYSLFDS